MALAAGDKLGPYEIVEPIGAGGMGEVYKARDTRLDRLVAIKIAKDQFTDRFQREARAVAALNHPNICHLYDVGPNYLVMEFIEGEPLKGPLPAAIAVAHAIKILDALEAAHATGIVHRDLKPGNILVTRQGVKLLDFGLAKFDRQSDRTPDETQTMELSRAGTVVGTPAYMAPEQREGALVDTRADVYAFGCILYELLTGKQAGADRTSVKPSALERVIRKCVARNPAERWQSVCETRQQLKAASVRPKWNYLVAAAAALALAGLATLLFRDHFVARHEMAVAPLTAIIADFSNRTGDPSFDGALESTLKLALEGAGFISAFDRGQLRALGVPSLDGLDEAVASKIAVSQGLSAIVSGSLERKGTGYSLAVKVVQTVTGGTLASARESAASKDQVLFALTKAARVIREGLGDSTLDSTQRFAMDTLTATSLESVHEYARGMEALSDDKNEDALKSFSKAVDVDPNFGMAYAGKAMASRNLGRRQDAEGYIQEALKHIDRMTERERYRTRGVFYFISNDYQKCTVEYTALIARFSSDVAAHNNLGVCYVFLRNLPKAIEEMERAAEILPKRPAYRFNHALYQAYAGNFATAKREAQAALEMNPAYESGYLTMAYAQLGQNELDQAKATYRTLDKIGAAGASMAASGFADLALYDGRYADAVRILLRGTAQDLAAGRKDAASDKLSTLANVQMLRGQKGPAIISAQRALDLSDAVKTRFISARVFLEAGETAKARMLASMLAAETRAEPQAYANLIEGEIALKSGDAHAAAQSFIRGNTLLDTWIGNFDLGRAYLELQAFTNADLEFDRCIKRRGEAMELFMDDVPTYGYFPPVYYYVGRVREGLKSSRYADFYRMYTSIRGKAGEDPLLSEVRRRIQ